MTRVSEPETTMASAAYEASDDVPANPTGNGARAITQDGKTYTKDKTTYN